MLFFQSIFCSNELKWIKNFNSFQSIFVCWVFIKLRSRCTLHGRSYKSVSNCGSSFQTALRVVNDDATARSEAELASKADERSQGTTKEGRKDRKEVISEEKSATPIADGGNEADRSWRIGGAGGSAPGVRQGAQEGSGIAGAVGMKHSRAMWCGPSWRGEREPLSRFLPPSRSPVSSSRECLRSRASRVPLLPEARFA